jgi:methyl-accepting chemotaxis protein
MGAGPVTAAIPAALGGAALAWWAARQDDEGGVRHFAHTVGEEIDAIMIGAAETSYFVDSVKENRARRRHRRQYCPQLQPERRHHRAHCRQCRAGRQIAAQVRGETVAGRTEADSGLQRIRTAREDAQTAAA